MPVQCLNCDRILQDVPSFEGWIAMDRDTTIMTKGDRLVAPFTRSWNTPKDGIHPSPSYIGRTMAELHLRKDMIVYRPVTKATEATSPATPSPEPAPGGANLVPGWTEITHCLTLSIRKGDVVLPSGYRDPSKVDPNQGPAVKGFPIRTPLGRTVGALRNSIPAGCSVWRKGVDSELPDDDEIDTDAEAPVPPPIQRTWRVITDLDTLLEKGDVLVSSLMADPEKVVAGIESGIVVYSLAGKPLSSEQHNAFHHLFRATPPYVYGASKVKGKMAVEAPARDSAKKMLLKMAVAHATPTKTPSSPSAYSWICDHSTILRVGDIICQHPFPEKVLTHERAGYHISTPTDPRVGNTYDDYRTYGDRLYRKTGAGTDTTVSSTQPTAPQWTQITDLRNTTIEVGDVLTFASGDNPQDVISNTITGVQFREGGFAKGALYRDLYMGSNHRAWRLGPIPTTWIEITDPEATIEEGDVLLWDGYRDPETDRRAHGCFMNEKAGLPWLGFKDSRRSLWRKVPSGAPGFGGLKGVGGYRLKGNRIFAEPLPLP